MNPNARLIPSIPMTAQQAALLAAQPAPKSPFTVELASHLHAGDFTGAAEHIERSLLDAGVVLLNSKLPGEMPAMAAPVEQALEEEAIAATGDALGGRPFDMAGMEARITGGIVSGLEQVLAKLLKK